MYPKFIELHDVDDGFPFSVNIEHLVEFYGDENNALISLTNEKWYCQETYAEIKLFLPGDSVGKLPV